MANLPSFGTSPPAAALPTILAGAAGRRPAQPTIALERLYRKQRLAAAFRIFGRLGFDFGGAGHITVRDPEQLDRFWLNPLGFNFSQIRVSDLMLVDEHGEIVEHGEGRDLNPAAFAIHSRLHAVRSDVEAAVHAHSIHGKAFSSLGKLLDPLTQDSCAFYEDHALFDSYSGVVLDRSEGDRIAETLGGRKALILQNHGLLTVGPSIESAAWWFIAMEDACQVQLLAEAAGSPKPLPHDVAAHTAAQVGKGGGDLAFKIYFDVVAREEPDLFD